LFWVSLCRNEPIDLSITARAPLGKSILAFTTRPNTTNTHHHTPLLHDTPRTAATAHRVQRGTSQPVRPNFASGRPSQSHVRGDFRTASATPVSACSCRAASFSSYNICTPTLITRPCAVYTMLLMCCAIVSMRERTCIVIPRSRANRAVDDLVQICWDALFHSALHLVSRSLFVDLGSVVCNVCTFSAVFDTVKGRTSSVPRLRTKWLRQRSSTPLVHAFAQLGSPVRVCQPTAVSLVTASQPSTTHNTQPTQTSSTTFHRPNQKASLPTGNTVQLYAHRSRQTSKQSVRIISSPPLLPSVL
jgi:hypothetical protein